MTLHCCYIVPGMTEKRELLRHTLATVAYRATRALEAAPESFATFDGVGRQPIQIMAHVGDLFDWALSIASGSERWQNSPPLDWSGEQHRFFATLGALDAFLASASPLHAPIESLFQGPVADALTHVGQLAMMSRLAGFPIRGENYYVAAIAAGQVDSEQPAPVKPFKQH